MTRRVWPDADRLDITRQADPKHIAFGFGEHICAGAALARLEIRVFWEDFFSRFSRWELADEPHRPDSTMHNSFESPSRCAFIDADPKEAPSGDAPARWRRHLVAG